MLLSDIWYYCNQYWIDIHDPRTTSYPIASGGPGILITILLSYLLFVKQIGPKLMKNRQPFELRWAMLIYNITMVLVNLFFFYHLVSRCEYGKRFLVFKFPPRNDFSPKVMSEIKLGFYCYLTRFMDLLDTVFFVLRKKYNQITFLHLYHHTLVPIMGWLCLKIAPQAPVIGLFLLFNTWIHSVMYLYYALAAFGPGIRKYLWWKKYITQMQLVQFAVCFCYGVVMVFVQEGFPPGLFWLGFAQNPFFFYMFYQFYKQTYKNEKRGNQQRQIDFGCFINDNKDQTDDQTDDQSNDQLNDQENRSTNMESNETKSNGIKSANGTNKVKCN